MASVQVPAPGSQGYTLAEVAWVLSLLENVGHHDHHVRSGTDRSLLDLMTHRPDNAVQIFIHLVDNKQLQVHIRQLCLVLLSQLVQRLHPDFCRWEGLSSHSQQFVTEFAFKQSCESKEKLMRKASNVLLTKIISKCSLEQRYQIFSAMVSVLNGSDLDLISAIIRCLCIVVDEVDYLISIEILRHCYPRLQDLVKTLPRSSRLVRGTCKILHICVEKLGGARIAEGFDEPDDVLVRQFITSWSVIVSRWISDCLMIDDILSNKGTYLEMITALSAAVEAFPEECIHSFPAALQSSWAILHLVHDTYMMETYGGMGGGLGSGVGTIDKNSGGGIVGLSTMSDVKQTSGTLDYSSDGDRIDLEMLVLQILELLCSGLSSLDSDSHMFLGGSIQHLITILGQYMQLTTTSIDQWTRDANEFVYSEYCEVASLTAYNLRHRGAELIREMCKYPKISAVNAILTVVRQLLQDSGLVADVTKVIGSPHDAGVSGGGESSFEMLGNPTMAASSPSTQSLLSPNLPASLTNRQILHLEGLLWCVGSMGKAYMKSVQAHNRYAHKDPSKLSQKEANKKKAAEAVLLAAPLEHVAQIVGTSVLALLQPGTSPFLSGRATWLFGIFADLFIHDPSTITLVSRACLELMAPTFPLTVRLQSCRTLSETISKVAQSFSTPPQQIFLDIFGSSIISLCLQLIPCVAEITVHFPLELLGLILRHFGDIAVVGEASQQIAQIGIDVFSHYSSDHLAIEVSHEMLVNFINLPSGIGAYISFHRLVPFIQHTIEHATSIHTHVLDSFITLLVKIGTSPLVSMGTAPPLPGSSYNTGGGNGITFPPTTPQTYKVVILQILIMATLRPQLSHCHPKSIQSINAIISHTAPPPLSQILSHEAASIIASKIMDIINSVLLACLNCEDDDSPSCDSCGPIAGLINHLLLTLGSMISEASVVEMMKKVVECMRNTQRTYVKYSLAMGLIHLFARNAAVMVSIFDVIGDGSILFILDTWSNLHEAVDSRYCGLISTLGLIEVINIFNTMESKIGYVQRLCKLVVRCLPNILAKDCELYEGSEDIEDGDVFYLQSDDEESDDIWCSDDGEDNQSDIAIAESEAEGGRAGSSPFATGEKYLSDLLEDRVRPSNDVDDLLVLNISDDLVFSPPSNDPLAHVDLQQIVSRFFLSQRDGETGTYACWIESSLSQEEKQILSNLLAF